MIINLIYGRIKDGAIVYDNQKEAEFFLRSNNGKIIQTKRTTYMRTEQQNSALHKYFSIIADELTKLGLTFDFKLGDKIVKLDWTPALVKESMWKPIQEALTGKQSTTQLDKTSEIDIVYEHINKFLSGEPFFLYIPFPAKEEKAVNFIHKK